MQQISALISICLENNKTNCRKYSGGKNKLSQIRVFLLQKKLKPPLPHPTSQLDNIVRGVQLGYVGPLRGRAVNHMSCRKPTSQSHIFMLERCCSYMATVRIYPCPFLQLCHPEPITLPLRQTEDFLSCMHREEWDNMSSYLYTILKICEKR